MISKLGFYQINVIIHHILADLTQGQDLISSADLGSAIIGSGPEIIRLYRKSL